MPTHLSTTEPDPADLADLDALAEQLNRLGFPSLLLTPPGKAPYVDTGLPQGMTPGQRIYTHAGTFIWAISPSKQPARAAAIIARALRPGTPQA